jgi:muramoyltetrapeptide carboxypeptidase
MPARQRPPRLQSGMTLGIVAPSSPVFERADVHRGVAALETLGFQIVFGPHAHDRREYLAGHDRDRADDLLAMFFRDDVDAVLCLRGGTGATRTAYAMDRDHLARLRDRPPKPFIGYSDISVFHALFGKELGWVTFYGPVLTSFAHATDYTLASFRQALMETEPFDILPSPDDPYVETIVPGVVEGELVGGTLPVLNWTVGTPWELDLRDKILFIETTRRGPGDVDRFLTHLLAAGRLQQCAGLVIGELFESGPQTPGSLSLAEIFDDLIVPLGIPTLYNLPIGHGKHHATLPIGVRARLDATEKRLRILEPGVQ